jgi:sarcosine oxidase
MGGMNGVDYGADYDAVVVGLGVMGSAALWRLAARGLRVAGVEQFAPGHTRGASHGQSRIIRTAYSEGPQYVPLVVRAWKMWDELSRIAGAELITRTGGLIMAPQGSGPLDDPLRSARRHGLGHELLGAEEIRRRFPQHRIDDGIAGFYERGAGVIRAEEAVQALVKASGAPVFSGSRVVRVEPGRVELADRVVTARHIVVAAGGWTPALLPVLAPKISVVRRLFAWFACDPAEYGLDRFPIFLRSNASGDHTWYGVPSVDGRTVKIGVHTWPGIDEPVDVAAGARAGSISDAEFMAALVAEGLPGLAPEPVRMQACTYSYTGDRDFLVGPVPGVPGIVVLAGFSGHGFKFAPVLGDIAADLVVDGQTRWDIGFLSPAREGATLDG